MNNKRNSRGVTLVEIAIVLVIIGLLLGGILKGQELINNAKVRSIADRQQALKVAWFSFLDRFSALPGDFSRADQYIPGAANGSGDGIIAEDESVLVFQHLTAAGYLRCSQCTETIATSSSANNSLQNSYGGIMSIWNDSTFYSVRGSALPTQPRLQVHTGPRIPSNIISEVDRKIDDGNANTGDFVFNTYDPSTAAVPVASECTSLNTSVQENGAQFNEAVMYWRVANATPPIYQNCGASLPI